MKGGQVKLSFGMIFSIILIVFFIAFAFFAIQKFLGLGETISVGKFADNFQSDVDKMWKSSQGSQEKIYSVPDGIEQICFVNLLESERGAYELENYYEEFERYSSDKNLFFYPVDSTELNGIVVGHIELGGNNPDCFEVKNGKVEIALAKNFGEALVSVTGFSVNANLPITGNGILEETFTLALDGGNFQLIAPAGIGMFSEDGSPLYSFSIEVLDVSLDSSYSNVVGNIVYDMQPDGANFDSPIEIQISYDESDIPKGFSENNLIVVQVSGGVKKVIEDYNIDTDNNIITAKISHFSSIYVTPVGSVDDVVILVNYDDSGTAGPFVAHLYEACLGRNAEYAGYLGWKTALDNGGLNAKQVVSGFVFSQEFTNLGKTNEQFVDTLYNCTLGRTQVDITSTSHYTSLESGAMSREQILSGFLNSEEFTTVCSSYGVVCGEEITITSTAVTCSDGIQNQNETGVDCGGECTACSTTTTTKTKCSPVQLSGPGQTIGWASCRTNSKEFDASEHDKFTADYTAAGCRQACGEEGYKSWSMWGWDYGWDMNTDPDCLCGDETITKTHCTFRAGTCVVSNDQRDCEVGWSESTEVNYHNIYWGRTLIKQLREWVAGDDKYYDKYFDSGGYRYTKGVLVKSVRSNNDGDLEVTSTYETCRRPLTEILDCQKNSDCDDYCFDEESKKDGSCEDEECYCYD